ncbi:MAG: xanthine dehydrogenase family protein subunit M [Proteobacteria bacterium]|nr:xanthine dehydrogenase family protein subunit M [Pseudomonadota bacterium]
MAVFYRKLPRFDYVMPKTLDDALTLLNEHKGMARLLAGGTDLIPQLKQRAINVPRYLIDLKAIGGLDTISYDEQSGLKIGPLTTISAIEKSPVIRQYYPSIAQAASCMASPQIRNRGTFAGNICNAVPSADSAPALLTMEAAVKIKGPNGERIVPIDQYFVGPCETILQSDEIVIEITVPKPSPASCGVYLKLAPRHSMDLAIVGVAALGALFDGICKDIRIGLGAVAPTPLRARKAEAVLLGQKPTLEIIEEAARMAGTECSPIDDHRASAEYRCDMVYILTKRALKQVFVQ